MFRLFAKILLCLVVTLSLSLDMEAYARGGGGGGGGHAGGSKGGSHSGGSKEGSHNYRGSHSSKGSHARSRRSTGTTESPRVKSSHRSTTYMGGRDSRGRIQRSSAEKAQFERETGYPHGRPGYVVDHIVPLKKNGCDCPSNMQWQTIAAAKAKDKIE